MNSMRSLDLFVVSIKLEAVSWFCFDCHHFASHKMELWKNIATQHASTTSMRWLGWKKKITTAKAHMNKQYALDARVQVYIFAQRFVSRFELGVRWHSTTYAKSISPTPSTKYQNYIIGRTTHAIAWYHHQFCIECASAHTTQIYTQRRRSTTNTKLYTCRCVNASDF